MNSALQCFLHLPELSMQNLQSDIQKRSSKNDFQLMKEFHNLYQKMWSKERSVINTREFLMEFMKRCRKENIYFESFLQNDAHEFITILIDLLSASIKRSVNIQISGTAQNDYDKMKLQSIHTWEKFFKNNYSTLIGLFYTKTVAFTICDNCDYSTTNHEPMSNITLTIDLKYESIYDCLNEYTRHSRLDNNNKWKCDNCNEYVLPYKKNIFFNLSPLLIFSLKLFRNGRKLNGHISFPEKLDMKEYVIAINNQTYNYELSGICIHNGTLNGGHYYAMCKNYQDKNWYIFNDTNVQLTTIDHVLKESPYCLFYRKID
tara:strand:+ start:354 stop:1304 length:951 start_codon:yes stop_codon:yes gene_type:complete